MGRSVCGAQCDRSTTLCSGIPCFQLCVPALLLPRRGPGAPYQKDAARRAAERALRPWDPTAGLGERQGQQQLQVGDGVTW